MDRCSRGAGSDLAGRPTPADPGPGPVLGHPTVYEVRVKGHLDDRWGDWLEGLSVTREAGGDTVLTVPVRDQAELHALLRKLRDLAVPLVSINPGQPMPPGSEPEEGDR